MKHLQNYSAFENKTTDVFDQSPKLKDLKQFGVTYTVKAVKELLAPKTRPDGTFGNNKWNREFMPFPPELDLLNILIQSKLGQYYFKTQIEKRGIYDYYNWEKQIKKEDLDNFPLPEFIFKTAIDATKSIDTE